MCSHFRRAAAGLNHRPERFAGVFLALLCVLPVGAETLRVCADPNNLPFSNQRGEGFENRLAEMTVRALQMQLEYVWYPERGAFLQRTLNAGACDAVMGVPTALSTVTVTRPYYSSTYVFVSRKDRNFGVRSLLDPALAKLRVGIHRAGEGYTPPALALGRSGHGANLVSYSLFGPPGEESPASQLISAVANGAVDVAVVWGPTAGYFVARQTTPLIVTPVEPAEFEGVPFTYAMSIGVAKNNQALRDRLDRALAANCSEVRQLLTEYGIPQVDVLKGGGGCEQPSSPRASSH